MFYDNYDAVVTFAHTVAEYLDGWEVRLIPDTYSPTPTVALVSGEYQINLSDWHVRGKITFWPSLPDDKHNDVQCDIPRRKPVTVSITRNPKAAAADIKRRVITPYLQDYSAILAEIEKGNERRKVRDALVAEIFTTVRGRVSKTDPGGIYFDGENANGEIRVYKSGGAHVAFNCSNPEFLKELAALIAKYNH